MTAKQLARKLRARCVKELEHGKSYAQPLRKGRSDYPSLGEHWIEVSEVFRGGPSPYGSPEHERGYYHFSISEEKKAAYKSDTVWFCTVYVARDLDVFTDATGSVPRSILACALGGR